MKSIKKIDGFDYSEYESKEATDEAEFWGIHKIDNRLYVDIKRYEEMCKKLFATEFLNDNLLSHKSENLYLPNKIHRHDYHVNLFTDLINELRKDWHNEYKPLFKLIQTPKEVHDKYRTEAMMYTSNVDDLDEIDVGAMFAGIKRENKYRAIIQSLYCQFISKVATEIDRFTLMCMIDCGYKGNDFTTQSFFDFSDGLLKNKKGAKIDKLLEFEAYDRLHKINNFLKHNTKYAYDKLKRNYPDSVASPDNKTAPCEYKNGMFAGNWIIVSNDYIDELLDKLIVFFKDYCIVYLKEDLEAANWDYDDYFKEMLHEVRCIEDYWGI